MMPTRKRSGTLGQAGSKRQRLEPIAAERKLSAVVEGPAEGQPLFEASDKDLVPQYKVLHEGDTTEKGAHEQHSPVLLLDVFCGTAGVAAAFIQLGGEALGLDHVVNKKKVRGPVSRVDLCKRENQNLVIQWLHEGRIDGVMLAPPCGTSSRAREIPVFQTGKKRRAPKPLRSKRWPNGIPSLRGLDATKVKLANKLYAFTRRVIDVCMQKSIPFICENPQRSWMWETSFFLDLPEGCKFQTIHSCMYGSQRLKKTALLMDFDAPNLQLTCDGKHAHLPWGKATAPDTGDQVFSTSMETEYPWKLCKQLALAFAVHFKANGKPVGLAAQSMDVHQRMGAGVQPRGKLSPLLVAEFKHKVLVKSSGIAVPKVIEDHSPDPFQGVPIHSKLISSRTEVEKRGMAGESEIQVQVSEFGVYRSPEEFLKFASQLQHPLDSPQLLDPSNMKAMLAIRDWPVADVLAFRARNLRWYTDLAVKLQEEEQQLRNNLDPQVAAVLKGKRLMLFQKMCEDAGVQDRSLFQEFTEGFKLTGLMQESGHFPRKLKPASLTVQQLRDSSTWAKRMIYASCKKVSAEPDVARAVYQETQQQLDDGWVLGPFTMEDMDRKFSGCWVPSKRFGVKQGEKVRAVDDFSEFLVNASVTSIEKLALYGLDEVVNSARFFMGVDSIELDVEGQPHLRWPVDGREAHLRELQGRALDLKAAYKQLARSPSDAWASVLAVWNPDKGDVEYYESIALPFGSVSAVMCFNRMARALRIIMSELFLLVNTNFFDDFCQLEVKDLCKSSWETAEMVMKLLGWRISTSDDKRLPFAPSFQMLGAIVDLSQSGQGLVTVKNKPSRLEDIAKLVESVLIKPKIPLSTIETLRGRLLYAASHTFGRCTHLTIQLLSRASRSGPMVVMDE